MTRAFKHLQSAHVGAVLSGSWKLTDLHELRKAELGSLSDTGEGLRGVYFPEGTLFDSSTRSGQIMRQNAFPAMDLHGQGVISNVYLHNVPEPEYWVLCLSTSATRLANYDATVEVASAEDLALALHWAHPRVLGPPIIGLVDYTGRQFEAGDPGGVRRAFHKPKDYALEKELRVVWPRRNRAASPFFTQAFTPHGLVKRR